MKLISSRLSIVFLAARIKAAQPVEFIPEEIKTHRQLLSGRKHVDDAAANGIVTMLDHSGRLSETHAHEKTRADRSH